MAIPTREPLSANKRIYDQSIRIYTGALLGLSVASMAQADDDPSSGSGLAGPDSVTEELVRSEGAEGSYALPNQLGSFDRWKSQLQEDHGLSFGLSAYLLYQQASESLAGRDDDAMGGVYRFQGSWEAFARGTGHPGWLEWRLEQRTGMGSLQSPNDLSQAVGAAPLNTGFGYSDDFDLDLAVINWTQSFNRNRGAVAIGRLAFDAYMDPYPFQTFSGPFLNRAFVLNPTIATTGIGALGTAAKGFVTDNIWIGGQIYDANAVSGRFDSGTFRENEWLSAAEIGWAPSIDRYDTDRIQLTYWHKDERKKAKVAEGYGFALTASRQVTEEWLPFVRFGWSDGGAGVPAELAASTGFEYMFEENHSLGFGAGWARPANHQLRDEYALEASYSWQIAPGISLTPGLQAMINPTKNPETNMAWIGGIRCIVTF